MGKNMPQAAAVAPDLDKLRDERCIPMAREVLKAIANQPNLALGSDVSEKERIECYESIFNKIMDYFRELDVPLKDIGYVFTLVTQGLNFTKDLVTMSMDNNVKRADSKLWGKNTDDLTVQDVDKVLLPVMPPKE